MSHFLLQDSKKITDFTKECEESKDLIPKLEENIPKLQKSLLDEERILDEIKENAKGMVFFLQVSGFQYQRHPVFSEVDFFEAIFMIFFG